jgi:hypothetical protein
MILSFHGGMCCGIKHIYNLGTKPEEMCEAEPATGKKFNDVSYDYCRQDVSVYPDERPAETKLERMDRYLTWLSEYRPSGIVEVAIVQDGSSWMDQSKWIPLLKERGFREVTPKQGVYNSNSGNRVHVYHLYMEKGDYDPFDDEDFDDYDDYDDSCDDDCDCNE